MTGRSGRSSLGGGAHAWAAVGLVAWVTTPLVLVASLTWASTRVTVAPEAARAWVAATAGRGEVQRTVSLALDWRVPDPVVAPGWTGLVREVAVAPGTVVTSGTPVLRIDAVLRIAWHSPAPFYRPLTSGSAGDDVVALNHMLAALQLEHGDADRFTAATRDGVKALAARLGAERDGVFLPEWIVYLPVDEIEVAEVEAVLGAPAPSSGTPLLTRAAAVVAAELQLPERASLAGAPAEAAPDERLVVGRAQLQLDAARRAVAPEGVAVLTSLVDASVESVTASLVREVPKDAVEIPAAGVHTDRTGRSCVLARSGRGGSGAAAARAVSVVVVAGSAGAAVVTGDVGPGDEVGIGALPASDPCA